MGSIRRRHKFFCFLYDGLDFLSPIFSKLVIFLLILCVIIITIIFIISSFGYHLLWLEYSNSDYSNVITYILILTALLEIFTRILNRLSYESAEYATKILDNVRKEKIEDYTGEKMGVEFLGGDPFPYYLSKTAFRVAHIFEDYGRSIVIFMCIFLLELFLQLSAYNDEGPIYDDWHFLVLTAIIFIFIIVIGFIFYRYIKKLYSLTIGFSKNATGASLDELIKHSSEKSEGD